MKKTEKNKLCTYDHQASFACCDQRPPRIEVKNCVHVKPMSNVERRELRIWYS